MIKDMGSAEIYAKVGSSFKTYAILTPEGEWLEPGAMGWFGCSAASVDDEKAWDENYMDIIKSYLNKDLILTIVDCHI